MSSVQFIGLFLDYLSGQKNKPSKSTIKNYKADISQFMRWYENKYHEEFSPENISLFTISEYKSSRLNSDKNGDGVSLRSIERHFSSLRKFFNFLKLEGHISHSPFETTEDSQQKHSHDLFRLKDFKDYLYVYNASHLTIKNYIIDVRQFLNWASEVTGVKEAWDISEKNVFNKIDNPLIEEYKQRLAAQDFSPLTVNRKLSSLRKYLSWAASEGLIKDFRLGVSNTAESKDQAPKFKMADQEYQTPAISVYSRFAPLRLFQKIGKVGGFVFDKTITSALALFSEKINYLNWKRKGKPIFQKAQDLANNLKSASKSPILNPRLIGNLPKEMYAPLAISTKYLPWHKKAIHHARYTRPNWYKKYHSYSITHYFHLAILIIFMAGLGFGIYNAFFIEPKQKQPALAALPTAPPRILSFQGRLTDDNDNPISASTPLRFSIYNDESASGSALLWEEIDTIEPDTDGIFSIYLGNNTTIPSTLFTENASLWLGVTVQTTPELTPRQQLATVAYAANAETLQGLLPITGSGAGQTNVVLALDSSGNLSIGGSATPVFQATGGQFTLSGNVLALTTVAGTDSNVQIAPDGLGTIDLQKPIQNTTNNNNIDTASGAVEIDDLLAILATSSGQSALTIDQNGIGPIISASSSGTAKFTVGNDGGVTSGNLLSLANNTYNIGSSSNYWNNLYVNNIIGASSGIQGYWQRNLGALSPTNITDDFLLGSTATSSALFSVSGIASNQPLASLSGSLKIYPRNGWGGDIDIYGLSGSIITSTGVKASIQELDTRLYNQQSNTKEPTGFPNTSDTTLSFNNTTREFTITGTNFKIYSKGKEYTKNTETTTITDSTNLYYIYYEPTAMALTVSTTPWNLTDGTVQIATVYWDTASDVGLIGDDRHGLIMDGMTHEYLHNTVGTRYDSGLSGTFADSSFSISSGSIYDEDLKHEIGTETTTRVLYKNGSSDYTFTSEGSSYYYSSGGNIYYNNGTTLTAVPSNNYVAYWIFATNDPTTPIYSLMGQRVDTNLADARSNNKYESLTLGTLPFKEMKLLYRVILRNDASPYEETQDLRSISNLPSGTYLATVHNALTGLEWSLSGHNDINFNVNYNNDARIGIGTTSPSEKLDVSGNATVSGNLKLAGAARAIQTTANNTLTIGGDTTGDIVLMPLNGSGNIGIGTTTPETKLDVYGSGTIQTRIKSTNSTAQVLIDSATNSTARLVFEENATSKWQMGNIGTTDRFAIVNGTLGTTADNITILNTGNVGIDTTSPDAKLEIVAGGGDTQLRLTSTDGSVYSDIKTDEEGYLSFVPTGGIATFSATLNPSETDTYDLGSATRYWNDLYVNNIYGAGSVSGFWQRSLGALSPVHITDDFLLGSTATSSALFSVTGVASGQVIASVSGDLIVMPVDGARGRVGIGTTSPLERLDVNGNATISGNLKLAGGARAIQTTTNNTFTIGGDTTGDIILYPRNGVGQVGIGTTSPDARLTIGLDTNFTSGKAMAVSWPGATSGAASSTTTGLDIDFTNFTPNATSSNTYGIHLNDPVNANGTVYGLYIEGTNWDYGIDSKDTVYFETTTYLGTNSTYFDTSGNASTSANLTFSGASSAIQSTAMQSLTLGGATTGDIVFQPSADTDSYIKLTSNGTDLTIGTVGSSALILDSDSGTLTLGAGTNTIVNTDSNTDLLINPNGTGDIQFHSSSYYINDSGQLTVATDESINGIDIDAGAISDVDSILGNATSKFAFGGVALQNYSAISDSGTATYAASDDDLYVEDILEVGGTLYVNNIVGTGALGYWQRDSGNLFPSTLNDTISATSSASTVATFTTNNPAGTLVNNTLIQHIGAGTVTNLLNLTQSAGTATNALTFTGTFTNLVSSTALTITNAGNITTAGTLAVNGDSITADGATLVVNAGGNVDIQDALNADSITSDAGVSIAASQSYTGAGAVTVSSAGSGALTLDSDSGTLTLGAGTNTIVNTDSNTDLLINPNGTGDIQFHSSSYYINDSGQLTVATDESINGIDIDAGAISDVDSILGNATSKFAFGGVALQNYSAISDSGTATYAASDDDLYVEDILEVGGNLYTAGSISGFWQRNLGALSPSSITNDLLLGSISTSSAKFAVFNIAGGTPTASISATATGTGLSLGGDGTIQSLRNNTLTIGGNTTGDIVLYPRNGSGYVGIGTTSPTQKLYVDGNIGITNSGSILADNAAGTHIYSLARDNTVATASLSISAYGGIGFATSSTGGPETSGGYEMYIKTDGSVGIGNTSPLAKLDVTGSASLSANLSLRGAGTAHAINLLDNGTFSIKKSPGGDTGLTSILSIDTTGNLSAVSFKDIDNTAYYLDPALAGVSLNIGGTASIAANLTLKGAGTAHTLNILDNGTLAIKRSPSGDTGLATALFVANNGNVGIGTDTIPDNYVLYGYNDGTTFTTRDPFYFSSGNGTSGERDIFTIEEVDAGGGGQDESSVLKVLRSGNIHSNDDGTSLLELTYTGSSPQLDKHFYTLGRLSDEGEVEWGVDLNSANIWTSGSIYGGATGTNCSGSGAACFNSPTIAFNTSGNSYINTGGYFGISNTTPLTALDVTGSASLSANLSLRGAGTSHTLNILDNGYLNIQRSPGGDAGLATALYIKNNGYIGIGTNNPSTTLDIAPENTYARIASTADNGVILFTDSDNNATDASSYAFMVWKNSTSVGSGGTVFYVKQDGTTFIGALTAASSTQVCRDGSGFLSSCSSSIRYKTNVQSMYDGLDAIRQLRPVTFDWKKTGEHDFGLVAEEVQQVNPLYTFNNDQGEIEGVRYSQLTGVLINAAKELDSQQQILEEKVNDNSLKIAELLNQETESDTMIVKITDEFGNVIYSLVDALGNTVANLGQFSKIIAANIQAGAISASEITVDNLNIGGQGIRDYIASVVEEIINNNEAVSPVSSIDQIKTNIISPLASDSSIELALGNSKLEIKNTQTQQIVAAIDDKGNASFSGELASNSLVTNEATVAGTLRAQKIIADQIEGLNIESSTVSAQYITNNYYASESGELAVLPINTDYMDISTMSGQFIYVDNLQSQTATFTQGLISFGLTSLSDTSIVGQLAVGGNLILADQSINVLGADLEIQPLRQGGISFLSGLVKIDESGNLSVSGDATFAKDVTIKGKLATGILSPLPNQDLSIVNSSNSAVLSVNQVGDITSSGSATFGKLNLSLAKEALALSANEIIATGSAGVATISARQKELTIDNALITKDSLIYITPIGSVNGLAPYLLRQVPGESFTIGVDEITTKSIPFNWLIIN